MSSKKTGTSTRARAALAVALATATLASSPPVAAKRTRLLEVNLKTGKRKDIEGPKSRADLQLDSLLDGATGAAFSTKSLQKIEKALRRYLRSARPRAMPRLLLFLYPGRISRNRLKTLREVMVDVDLVVDPCGRTICRDAVAKHIELLGRSIRQAVIRTRNYTVRFKTVTIRTTQQLRGSEYEIYRFTADEVVKSGKKRGAGFKLVKRLTSAKEGYTRQMTKAIAKRVKRRRVRLAKAPVVEQDRKSVSVNMEIKSDRNRYRTHVLGALVGAAEALQKNPLTPPSSRLKVVASVKFRRVKRKTFTCTGQPLALYLRGRIAKSEVWSNFVVEHKKGGTKMSFSDEEASGGVESADDSPDRTNEILAEHFNTLAPCLQAEAGRRRRFRGVTLKFAVSGRGKAVKLQFKEKRVSKRLKQCLNRALSKIRFQKHGGAPRGVEYPMYIQR